MTPQLTPKEQADAIAEGVRQAFAERLVGIAPEDMVAAVTEGVRSAFDQVWGSQILAAIADGTREALKGDG